MLLSTLQFMVTDILKENIKVSEDSDKAFGDASFSFTTRSIIVAPNLICLFSYDEVLAILAHEIGHSKHRIDLPWHEREYLADLIAADKIGSPIPLLRALKKSANYYKQPYDIEYYSHPSLVNRAKRFNINIEEV